MSSSVQNKSICFLLLLVLVSNASSQQQQQQQQLNPPAAIQVADSNSPAAGPSPTPAGARDWPLVNVDDANNQSTVGVKVPIVFNMLNQVDKNTGDHKLNLSVLQGLVTVDKDKTRNEKGEVTGPLRVTVFGIPVYNGRNYLGSGARAAGEPATTRSSLDNSIETKQSSAEESLSGQVRAFNEKLASSLSDFLARLSSSVRRASQRTADPEPMTGAPVQTGPSGASPKQTPQ